MRFSCVGAVKVSVTRCSFTRRSHTAGSNLRNTTMVPPSACANSANESGPEWYSGPVVRCTDGLSSRCTACMSAAIAEASVPVRIAPLGFPVVPDV